MTALCGVFVRIAVALGIGMLALLPTGAVVARLARTEERYRVWRAALLAIALGAILAATGVVPIAVQLPPAAARAAYNAGLPVTELVSAAGASTAGTKRIIPFGPRHAAATFLLLVWGAGTALLLLRFLHQYRAAAALAAAATPLPPRLLEPLLAALPYRPRARFEVCIAERGTPAFVLAKLRRRAGIQECYVRRRTHEHHRQYDEEHTDSHVSSTCSEVNRHAHTGSVRVCGQRTITWLRSIVDQEGVNVREPR